MKGVVVWRLDRKTLSCGDISGVNAGERWRRVCGTVPGTAATLPSEPVDSDMRKSGSHSSELHKRGVALWHSGWSPCIYLCHWHHG